MHNMYHHVDSRSMKQLFWKIFKIYKKKSFPKFPHKKLSRIQFATVMKKRLLYRCIPVSFTKFLKTIFCRTETAKWCVFFKKVFLTLIRLGFSRVVRSGWEGSIWPVIVFQKELIWYQHNFIKLLNNLFEVCWKWNDADIIFYKMTPLVSL